MITINVSLCNLPTAILDYGQHSINICQMWNQVTFVVSQTESIIKGKIILDMPDTIKCETLKHCHPKRSVMRSFNKLQDQWNHQRGKFLKGDKLNYLLSCWVLPPRNHSWNIFIKPHIQWHLMFATCGRTKNSQLPKNHPIATAWCYTNVPHRKHPSTYFLCPLLFMPNSSNFKHNSVYNSLRGGINQYPLFNTFFFFSISKHKWCKSKNAYMIALLPKVKAIRIFSLHLPYEQNSIYQFHIQIIKYIIIFQYMGHWIKHWNNKQAKLIFYKVKVLPIILMEANLGLRNTY